MRIIIIGATSGIGRELALQYVAQGAVVGVMGRREPLLQSLQVPYVVADVTRTEEAVAQFNQLIRILGGLDIVILAAGVGSENPTLDFSLEAPAIAVNVMGFTALADAAYAYFAQQGHGQVAAISSIAGLLPGRFAPAYSASKAYMISYLTSLRAKARHDRDNIYITDLRPGFVDTPLVAGNRYLFWVASPQKAAKQIICAIRNKRRIAYITHRWYGVGWLLRLTPTWIVERL